MRAIFPLVVVGGPIGTSELMRMISNVFQSVEVGESVEVGA